MNKPEMNEGEIYVGAIINPDSSGHHIILLLGDFEDVTWQEAMDWAKSIGGDLPDRVEQGMLFKYMKDQFKPKWYWSNTQHATSSGSAWCHDFSYGSQDFYYGDQDNYYESSELSARAVRRVKIGEKT